MTVFCNKSFHVLEQSILSIHWASRRIGGGELMTSISESSTLLVSSVYLGLSVRSPFADILFPGDTIVSWTVTMVMSFQPKLSVLGIIRLILRWFLRMSFMSSSREKPKKYFDHREVSAWMWRVDVFLIVIHFYSHVFRLESSFLGWSMLFAAQKLNCLTWGCT